MKYRKIYPKHLPRARSAHSLVSPDYFENGEIGRQTATRDDYFSSPDAEEASRMVIDNFVNQLPEWKRTAVQMCIMANLTYEEAAEEISILRGKKTDKKTVWRWARAGVEDMKGWLVKSPWVASMTNNKIPVERINKSKPIDLPWRSKDGV